MVQLHDSCNLQEVVVTNSVPQAEAFEALPFTTVRCLSQTFSWVVNRIHCNRPVTDLTSSPELRAET
jgi:phosphoribosylpyrophosphate synthetase